MAADPTSWRRIPAATRQDRTDQASPRPVVVVWTERRARGDDLGALLDATVFVTSPRLLRRRALLPLRYTVSAIATLLHLFRHRPHVVVVQNPPVPAAAVVAWYAAITGSVAVLDSHPGGFGAQGDRLSGALQWLHRWAVRRAALVLVTTPAWVNRVAAWGGTGLVLHEPPAAWAELADQSETQRQRPRVLSPGIFQPDEPVIAIAALAQARPDIDVIVTGDPRRAPDGFSQHAPPNLHLVGYLDQDAYVEAVLTADIVLALTTEPTSVMRVAYEAVFASRPLVVSDWSASRELFPYAVHVANDADALVRGVSDALGRLDELRGSAAAARQVQLQRWEEQVAALRTALAAADNRCGHQRRSAVGGRGTVPGQRGSDESGVTVAREKGTSAL